MIRSRVRPTTIIIRGGVEHEDGFRRSINHIRGCVQKMRLSTGVPVVERIICVPESQFADYNDRLRGFDLAGFKIKERPDSGSFGEDWSYMEWALTKNPGQLVLTDSDFWYAESQQRTYGEDFYDEPVFSRKFANASLQADRLKLTMWGIRQHNRMGGKLRGKTAPISKKSTANGGFTLGLRYLRNFFVITDKALGSWKPWNYLEDFSRVLSEHGIRSTAVGQCDSMMVRYSDGRTSRDYQQQQAWAKCKKSLEAEYGEDLVRPRLTSRRPPNRKD